MDSWNDGFSVREKSRKEDRRVEFISLIKKVSVALIDRQYCEADAITSDDSPSDCVSVLVQWLLPYCREFVAQQNLAGAMVLLGADVEKHGKNVQKCIQDVDAAQAMLENIFDSLPPTYAINMVASLKDRVNEIVNEQILCWVDENLKGDQKKMVRIILDENWRIPLSDLALELEWGADYENKFNRQRCEVNKKLQRSRFRFRIVRNNNNATIVQK